MSRATIRIPVTTRITKSQTPAQLEIVLHSFLKRTAFVDLVDAGCMASADTFRDEVLFRNALWDRRTQTLSTTEKFENRAELWLLPFVADELRRVFPPVLRKPGKTKRVKYAMAA